MLGKQAWRLLSDPETLVSKVLKAKYYPRGDFLNASLGHGPSFMWRSIWGAQALLDKGSRWKIEDGMRVSVWRDSWLRDSNNFCMETPIVSGLEDIIVNDLLIPGCQQWDRELLEEFFNARDVAEILKIPLCPVSIEDQRIWHYSKNGVYCVKSAYYLVSKLDSDAVLDTPDAWIRIWKAHVPPKVKNFAWRVCRDCLPTKINLQAKGLGVSSICILCGDALENAWHTLVACPFAMQCWTEAGLMSTVYQRANSAESVAEWIFKMLNGLTGFELGKFLMVAWVILREINNQLWNSMHRNAKDTVFSALDFLYAWLAAKNLSSEKSEQRVHGTRCETWHKPPVSFLTCNVDTAFFSQNNSMGVGMMLRNDAGDFVACRSRVLDGLVEIAEGEALGLHEALSWIRGLALERVIFEMDVKIVCDAIHSSSLDFSEFGTIIDRCRFLLSLMSLCVVRFVGRKANEAAHATARASCNFASPFVWSEPPSFLLTHIAFCTNYSDE